MSERSGRFVAPLAVVALLVGGFILFVLFGPKEQPPTEQPTASQQAP